MNTALPTALIGYTGLVGSNLLNQTKFDKLYNSKNSEEMKGGSFSLLVISCARAEKWKANQDPDGDFQHISQIVDLLSTVKADEVFLISTVDVYPSPVMGDEDKSLSGMANHAYGRNRLYLEEKVREMFPKVTIARLPGLFGPGLKKNAIFDLINNNNVEKIESRNVYQFYNLDNLWSDLSKARELGVGLLNIATEPTSVEEIAKVCFGMNFENHLGNPLVRYDMRSKFWKSWSPEEGYLYSKAQVLNDLSRFVADQKRGKQ